MSGSEAGVRRILSSGCQGFAERIAEGEGELKWTASIRPSGIRTVDELAR
jgi:hypothetical protein